MFVPKMTEVEIYEEFVKDTEWLRRTYLCYNHPYNLKIVASMRKSKMRRTTKISRVKTPNRNIFLLISTIDRIEESVSCYFVAIIPTEDNMTMYATFASIDGENHLHFFTTHFFERYKERMEEGGMSVKEPVMDFFKRNDRISGMPVYHDEYDNSVQFAVKDGMLLGNYRGTLVSDDMEIQMFDLRTFLLRGDNVSRRIQYADNEILRQTPNIINK